MHLSHHALHRTRESIEARHRREAATVEQVRERGEVRRGERVSEGYELRADVPVHFGVEDGEALSEADCASERSELESIKEKAKQRRGGSECLQESTETTDGQTVAWRS
jgi:hypothetical protein